MSAVTSQQRHTKAHRCPVCGGADGDPRGKDRRCSGFTSSDGAYAHCSREEHAGGLDQEDGGTFAHRLHGSCKCGSSHGADLRAVDEIEAVYDYTDERGALLHQVVRKSGKRFLQRKPDGAGGWIWKVGEVRQVPYRLPELIAAVACGETVYICEGEKDCDAMAAAGFTATTNAGGAGKWARCADTARAVLTGADVIIFADADAPGRAHSHQVAASLAGVARSVQVVEAPAPFKDASALLSAGHSLGELVPLAADDVPAAEAPANDAQGDATPFRVWSAGEIWEPLPPVEYAIGGLVPRASLALLVAYGSSLKTWLMTDLVVAKPLGAAWLGRFACEPGAVLFWDWESGDHELRRRLQRVSAGRGHVGPVDGVSMVTMPDLFFNSAGFEVHVTELATSRALIVFDSLAAGTVDLDENDARFAKGLQTLKRIAVRTGCTFVVLHHTRKAPPQGRDADARESPRGTGAIFAACDVVLQLTKSDGEAMLVTQTKARAGKAIEPFTVRVDDVGEDGTRVQAGGAPSADDSAVADVVDAFARAKRKVLTLLGRDRDVRNATEVHNRIKGTKATNLRAVKELLDRRMIVEHEGALRLASEVS